MLEHFARYASQRTNFAQDEGAEIGVWHIAIVGCILLGPKLEGFEYVFVESTGFLRDNRIGGRKDVDVSPNFGSWKLSGRSAYVERWDALIAAIMNFTLFKFLTSQRVPQGSPILFTDTLTSHRSDPSSIFPSLAPTARRIAWRVRT